jgi:hypothetical protein
MTMRRLWRVLVAGKHAIIAIGFLIGLPTSLLGFAQPSEAPTTKAPIANDTFELATC